MRSRFKIMILATLVSCLPAVATPPGSASGVMPGFDSCSLGARAASGIVDPYSNLLPSELDSASLEISNSYKIDLKPFKADDMSQYQTMIRDTRSKGAGYSSPYLWEAGTAPSSSLTNSRWASPASGRSYYPVPMRRR